MKKTVLLHIIAIAAFLTGCAGMSESGGYKSKLEIERERRKEERAALRPLYIQVAKQELPSRLKKLWAGRLLENFDFGEPMAFESANYESLNVDGYTRHYATLDVTFKQNNKYATQNITIVLSEDKSAIEKVEDIGSSTTRSAPLFIFFTEDPLKKYRHDKALVRSIKEKKVKIGMPEDALFLSWGRPKETNSSVGSWGVNNQHVYGDRTYVYTKNGKVSSWQN